MAAPALNSDSVVRCNSCRGTYKIKHLDYRKARKGVDYYECQCRELPIIVRNHIKEPIGFAIYYYLGKYPLATIVQY